MRRRGSTAFRRLAERLDVESPRRENRYAQLYEAHAQSEQQDAIGGGDYDVVGAIELDSLRWAGLEPHHHLVDFGCGTGRLARHAIPYLTRGRYTGIDISPTFLARARADLAGLTATSGCQVEWVHQEDVHFNLPRGSVDVFSAFSVVTHMEHEDTYRYLVALKPAMANDGVAVISCLPLPLEAARVVFLAESALDPDARWSRVRNVVTTESLIEEVARLAEWEVTAWLPGDRDQVPADDGTMRSLGQSIALLRPIT